MAAMKRLRMIWLPLLAAGACTLAGPAAGYAAARGDVAPAVTADRVVTLAPLTDGEAVRDDGRIGVVRAVVGLASVSGGAVGVRSPGARGLRLGLRFAALPDDARLVFRGADGAGAVEVPAAEVAATLRANGGESLYWGPKTPGDTATVAVMMPTGAGDGAWTVAQVMHQYAEPAATRLSPGASSSANLDVSCYPEWAEQSKSVAVMEYVKDGSGYACTGTLIGDNAGTETPYFLSAGHCISTQAAASTLETTWFYHSASCGSGAANPGMTRLSGGATLLHAEDNWVHDISLLRLNRTPPSGAVFASVWPKDDPADGAEVIVIHHPKIDMQKISFGVIDYPYAGSVDVVYTAGLTEPGSSGSPLWMRHPDGNYYVIATLSGGRWDIDNYELFYWSSELTQYLGISAAMTRDKAGCLFDWAEAQYPTLFAPGGAAAQRLDSYYYRHYAGTGAYLGVSTQDDHVYYLGPLLPGALLDLGGIDGWLTTSDCPRRRR